MYSGRRLVVNEHQKTISLYIQGGWRLTVEYVNGEWRRPPETKSKAQEHEFKEVIEVVNNDYPNGIKSLD